MTNEPRRILIIENDIDTLSIIYTTLLPLDYSVEAAVDISELRPRIERFRPDLLMLGQKLTDTDVPELCQWIKNHYEVRVILIGLAQKMPDAWSDPLCFDDLLPKPIDPAELLAKISNLLPVE